MRKVLLFVLIFFAFLVFVRAETLPACDGNIENAAWCVNSDNTIQKLSVVMARSELGSTIYDTGQRKLTGQFLVPAAEGSLQAFKLSDEPYMYTDDTLAFAQGDHSTILGSQNSYSFDAIRTTVFLEPPEPTENHQSGDSVYVETITYKNIDLATIGGDIDSSQQYNSLDMYNGLESGTFNHVGTCATYDQGLLCGDSEAHIGASMSALTSGSSTITSDYNADGWNNDNIVLGLSDDGVLTFSSSSNLRTMTASGDGILLNTEPTAKAWSSSQMQSGISESIAGNSDYLDITYVPGLDSEALRSQAKSVGQTSAGALSYSTMDNVIGGPITSNAQVVYLGDDALMLAEQNDGLRQQDGEYRTYYLQPRNIESDGRPTNVFEHYSDLYTDGHGNMFTFVKHVNVETGEEKIVSLSNVILSNDRSSTDEIGRDLPYGLIVCSREPNKCVCGEAQTNCARSMSLSDLNLDSDMLPVKFSNFEQDVEREREAVIKYRNAILGEDVEMNERIWDVGWGSRSFNWAGAILESVQLAGSTQWLSDLVMGPERNVEIRERYDRAMSNWFTSEYFESVICKNQLPDVLPGQGLGQIIDSQGNPVTVAHITGQKHGPRPYMCDLDTENPCPEKDGVQSECVDMLCEIDDVPVEGYLYVIEWSVRAPTPLVLEDCTGLLDSCSQLELQVTLHGDESKNLYEDNWGSDHPIILDAGVQESDRIVTYSLNDYDSLGIYFRFPIMSGMGKGTTAFMERKLGTDGNVLREVTNTITEINTPATFSYGSEDELPASTLSSADTTVEQVQI